jgi:hypothetical protein
MYIHEQKISLHGRLAVQLVFSHPLKRYSNVAGSQQIHHIRFKNASLKLGSKVRIS